jgi:hypothetical protein
MDIKCLLKGKLRNSSLTWIGTFLLSGKGYSPQSIGKLPIAMRRACKLLLVVVIRVLVIERWDENYFRSHKHHNG